MMPKWALSSEERDALRAIKRVANREQWEQGGNEAQTVGFWHFRKAVRARRPDREARPSDPQAASRAGDGGREASRAAKGQR